jgi:hypothetical protein
MRKTHTAVVPPRRASTKFSLSRTTHATHTPRAAAPTATIQHGVHPMIFEDVLSFAANESFKLARCLTANQSVKIACFEAIKATENEMSDALKKRTTLLELAETRIQMLQSKLQSVESIVAEAQCDAAENNERLQDALTLAQKREKDLEAQLEAHANRLSEKFEARIKALNAAHEHEKLQFARRSEELKLERDQWQARTEKAYTHAANAGRRAVDEIASAAAAEHVSVRIYEATKARLIAAEKRAADVTKECDSLRGENNSLLGERDSLQGENNSLRGERDSLRGERDSLRGERDSLRGERDSLQSKSLQSKSLQSKDLEQFTNLIQEKEKAIEHLRQELQASIAAKDTEIPLAKHNSVCIKLTDAKRQYQAEKQARESAEKQVAALRQELQNERQRLLSAKKTLIPKMIEPKTDLRKTLARSDLRKVPVDKGDAARRRAEYSENLRRRNKMK